MNVRFASVTTSEPHRHPDGTYTRLVRGPSLHPMILNAKMVACADPAIVGPIDAAIDALYPDRSVYRRDEGVAYWRWLCKDAIDPEWQEAARYALEKGGIKVHGGFMGTVCGKPLTALFLFPRFP